MKELETFLPLNTLAEFYLDLWILLTPIRIYCVNSAVGLQKPLWNPQKYWLHEHLQLVGGMDFF